MTSIYYASTYGSTKQYAEELARRVGVDAVPIAEAGEVSAGTAAGPIVVLAPAHGPMHEGVKFVRSLGSEALRNRPAAVATTGMTIDDFVTTADPTGGLLGDLADSVTRFYLPGRLNYSELSAAHRNVMRGLITAVKMKPRKNENERNMIDSYGKDIDRVDFARLDPIVEWVEVQQI
ncbi:Flavodoxin domain protein [Corynebacterium glaucum]|uniref:Flavodoxin domain protein n=1 Tax=Corynebacterium glaucum TaxID=187491 RepID=A0A1Q2HZR9_9CORY|nr:flavodoxin domain-containing protein [Corynebacterium glaucum]AQQ16341.1 Flavodoxin domain protein [Corynebacterium glaucum]